MTTIAYDGHVLAADTYCHYGDVRASVQVSKVWHLQHCNRRVIVAGSGNPSAIMALARLFLTHIDDARRHHAFIPAPTFPKDLGGSLIVVDVEEKRVFHMGEDATCVEVTGAHAACGSGREFALGAMYHGASADKAVDVAKQLDPWTGGFTHSIRVDADHELSNWQEVP